MAELARIPKLGLTMKNAFVEQIYKREGDRVQKGEAILGFETDKLTGDVESPMDGYVLQMLATQGDTLDVLAPVAVIGALGESVDVSLLSPQGDAAQNAQSRAPIQPDAEPHSLPDSSGAATHLHEMVQVDAAAPSSQRIAATPVARKMAAEHHIDLSTLVGTSLGGKIGKEDVLLAIAQRDQNQSAPAQPEATRPEVTPSASQPEATPSVPQEAAVHSAPQPAVVQSVPLSVTMQSASQPISEPIATPALTGRRVRLSQMRKTIANRLQQSKQQIPHVYFVQETDATALMQARERARAQSGGERITYNDISLCVTARTLVMWPDILAQLAEDELVYPDHVDIAMAVSVPGGLITPVLRELEQMSLGDIARQSRALAERARQGSLLPEEYNGGGITMSNLGQTGIQMFIPILNPPQSAILGIGAITQKVVAHQNAIAIRPMITLALSADHRVIDGKLAADFLANLALNLSDPSFLTHACHLA
ncbi:2-oxo acid dehydrogenase subunit E2 [Eubacteriales bacterium OttesenSCG-928-N13]|nr:2-oxo acid dehydrogenase subunit E2 [Eubacteriales bacterium OttesenSCG-928-N13]